MKTTALIISMIVATNAMAFNDDPNKPFDTSNNYTTQSTITWRPVDDV